MITPEPTLEGVRDTVVLRDDAAPGPFAQPKEGGRQGPGLPSNALPGRLGPIRIADLAVAVMLAAIAVVSAGLVTGAAAAGLAAAALAAGATLVHLVRRLEARIEEARKLRNYRLVKPLGRGGMGEVWRAEHDLLPRPAAIKFISPAALGCGTESEREGIVRGFLEEARATATLSSPHTIELYDFGVTPDGLLCYVMEFLEGLDLETMVAEAGPLPPNRAIHLLRQACISLAESHQAGLVHRDIKPANIYACRKGIHFDFVKVLDFGIAARTSAAGPGLRGTRVITGTPATIAPETIAGRPPDPRVDVYALGCVAYWLLTGRYPFEGKDTADVLRQHTTARPAPPSQHSPNPVSRELDLAVLECLRKDPDERIASVIELSRRLAQCQTGTPWTPGRAMEWWRQRETTAAQGSAAATVRLRPVDSTGSPAPRAPMRSPR
jgi:serine/threonine-protein kinase